MACTDDGPDGSDSPRAAPEVTIVEGDGLIPADEWAARQDDYLAWATDQNGLDPGDLHSVLAHAERARRDDSFVWEADSLSGESLERVVHKLSTYQDTGDFDINEMLLLYTGGYDDLPADYLDVIEDRVLAFKYWWTEPAPEGIVDDQFYWTENHQIIYLANEYVAGQTFPDATFT